MDCQLQLAPSSALMIAQCCSWLAGCGWKIGDLVGAWWSRELWVGYFNAGLEIPRKLADCKAWLMDCALQRTPWSALRSADR
eukprot:10652616-Alexandrium_andersonii.AAC.1